MITFHPHERQRIAWYAIGVALFYFVLREWTRTGYQEPGFGTSVFIVGIAGLLALFARLSKRSVHPVAYWLLVPTIILAGDLTLYANPFVMAFGLVATGVLLIAFAVHLLSTRLTVRNAVWLAVLGPFALLPLGVRGTQHMVQDALGEHRSIRAQHLRSGILGVLIALPFLFVFGAILSDANGAFESFLEYVLTSFRLNGELIAWAFRVAIAVLLGGFLVGLIVLPAKHHAPFDPRMRPVTAATFFVLLDALFATFVAFQLPEFFASDAWMRAHDFTYATLARESFFSLLFAGALALLTVLLWYPTMTQSAERAQHAVTRIASTIFTLLTLVVAVSAITRIVRYVSVYGLTLDRVYAFIATIALGVTLGIVLASLWRMRPLAYVARTIAILGVIVFTLTMSVPMEYTVATWNVRRELSGNAQDPEFDALYILALSPDAWSALDALPVSISPSEEQRERRQWKCDVLRTPWQNYHLLASHACRKIAAPLTLP
ncbi:MAG: DUF4173 domain-containing protein [bacterium]|nr:DUF4173 domain-containing protein [bacterium]